MTRWSEEDLQRYVGPNGAVSRNPVPVTARASKRRYTAKPEWFDGVYFGSQRELARYKDLKLLEAGGAITDLCVHPRYYLHVGNEQLGFIELDFEYFDRASGKKIHEDVKDPKKNSSTRTAIFKWKRLHLKAEHSIEIMEVT